MLECVISYFLISKSNYNVLVYGTGWDYYHTFLMLIYCECNTKSEEMKLPVRLSVAPFIYCPSQRDHFELYDMLNKKIEEFNVKSGTGTFQSNSYFLKSVTEGRFGKY